MEGSKTCTIRSERKRIPRAGEMCHCYGDVRQKTMHLLGRWPCVKVERIRIEHQFGSEPAPFNFQVYVEGERLDRVERNALAWEDGFRSRGHQAAFAEMAEFWVETHGKGQPFGFTGHLIHWDYGVRDKRDRKDAYG